MEPSEQMRPLLPVRLVIDKANAAAREFDDSERLRVALAGAKADKGVLVQRLDARDRYYFIVTFSNATGETARMAMDAIEGRLTELTGIQKLGEQLPPYLTASAMLDRVHREAEKYAKSLKFQIRPESLGQHPVLVWLPCAQSSSPFLPFFQYSVGNSFLYYRIDGKRFERLTTGPA